MFCMRIAIRSGVPLLASAIDELPLTVQCMERSVLVYMAQATGILSV